MCFPVTIVRRGVRSTVTLLTALLGAMAADWHSMEHGRGPGTLGNAASLDSALSHCHDMAMPSDLEYSIADLADLAGVTPRTIRYYVSIGLLASPGRSGPKTMYGDDQLQRLRLIRKLQAEHLPLGEIAARLEGLEDEEVEMALEGEEAARPAGSALDYIRGLQAGSEAGRSPARALGHIEPLPLMSTPEPKPSSPRSVHAQRSQWDRVALSQNVELHIRRPLSRQVNKRIERLIRISREILEEDQS